MVTDIPDGPVCTCKVGLRSPRGNGPPRHFQRLGLLNRTRRVGEDIVRVGANEADRADHEH